MTQVAEHINEVKKDYETTLLVQVMYVHTLHTSIMLLLSMYVRMYVCGLHSRCVYIMIKN